MIRTVILDFGGVYFTDGTSKAIKEITATYGVPEPRVTEVLHGDLGTAYRIGGMTADQFWSGAKEYWGIEAENSRLAPVWIQAYEPIQGTVEMVDRLNTAGYEMLFLSDNVQERIEYLEEKYRFRHRFKDGVFSHVAGTRKPDPKIYEMVLAKSSHPAQECLFVDDKPHFLEPARMLGMSVIAFESPEQLKRELKSLGLDF